MLIERGLLRVTFLDAGGCGADRVTLPEAMLIVARAAAHDPEWPVREAAQKSLSEIVRVQPNLGEEACAVAVTGSEDEDPEVRRAAFVSLASILGTRPDLAGLVRPIAQKGTGDRTHYVRAAAERLIKTLEALDAPSSGQSVTACAPSVS